MAFSVTSWFQQQTENNFLVPVRKFLIGTSDYSSFVMRWPEIQRAWNDIKPLTATVDLANAEKHFNFINDDFTKIRSDIYFKMGFNHPTSGDELITLYQGKIEKVRYRAGVVSLTANDKFTQLSDRVIGSSNTPTLFTGSNYLPADVAWHAITSYGGYSNVRSTSNPDIDYTAWLAWSNVFSADSVYVNARFEGEKVTESLRRIGRITQSAIFIENNKISFHRFTFASSLSTILNYSKMSDFDMLIDDRTIVNKQFVNADWDVNSEYFKIVIDSVASTSVNSYGLREAVEKDEIVYYVNSTSALNLASRLLSQKKEPYAYIEVDTTLICLARQVGENIGIVNSFFTIDDTYRIMDYKLNMDTGMMVLGINKSQFGTTFMLDSSVLDGTDLLA